MQACVTKFSDKKQAQEGLETAKTLLEHGRLTDLVEFYPHIEAVMDLVSDKQKPVAKAADELAKLIYEKTPAWSAAAILPYLKKSLDGKAKPASKECALEIITKFSETNPKAISREIEWLISDLAFLMNDIKASVKTKAKAAIVALCNTCGNKDLIDQEFVPVIVKANENQKNVHECVEKLAGCIFVQNVEAPALSILTPVLMRGLKEPMDSTVRRCCVIVDNMCKLIDDPREGAPLLPNVLPLIEKKSEEISDPEARENAQKTLATIQKMAETPPRGVVDVKECLFQVDMTSVAGWTQDSQIYVQKCADALAKANCFDMPIWKETIGEFASDKGIEALKTKMEKSGEVSVEEFIDDDEESPDLYKGNFSLAYGTVTLLRDAKLHLKKNKFYGLLGPTNCGKTTLMRAISKEQVEGFPKRDELVTIFVEHEVEEREVVQEDGQWGPTKAWPLSKFNIDLSGVEFVVDTVNNVYKKQPPISADMVVETLNNIGFKSKSKGYNMKAAADMDNPITTYSGGWKVKMQLACANLVEADILMLDEPTGHMDVKNVQWMKDWLAAFPGTILATSTHTVFLNEMCTHIVDFQDRKLIQFKSQKGSVLTDFVTKYPEKNVYFELTNKNEKWNFPPPGNLEGVKSKSRAIMKMNNVAFRYPNHDKPTVQDICLSICMLSRIAVIGPNGAGKSTAIKLLIGELKQEVGTVWKHSGMRMAYVAQHAFHHLEKHLDKTATDYILWRFMGNDDRESLENQSKETNVDEEALRNAKWCIDSKSGVVRKCVVGEKGDVPIVPDTILNRKKNKQKKYEYETKMMFKPIEAAVWIERDTLVAMGYEKMVCRQDEKEAAAAGLMARPLTQPNVEKALKDFGLDVESASHTPINSLSGGQKVKVVLAAAMWQNPHILILDEPTNYLDRDGLGALVAGLKDYGGGVVIISHNMEFANSVCTQKWIMEAGRLREEGELQVDDDEIEEMAVADEVTDQYGNKIEVNKAKTMTDKERKKAIKEIEKKLKDHKKKNTLSEAEMWELQDKLAEYKNELGA